MHKKWLIIPLGFIVTLSLLVSQVKAQETKKVSVAGRRILITEGLLPYLGALTFTAPQEAEHPRPQVKGFARDPALSRIDGYNHTLGGQLVGSGDLPGITTNAKSGELFVRRVTVSGSPVPIKYEIDYIDIPTLTDYLKANADITITEDTVYKGGSIGSKDDPKIMVVDGARLKLMQDFEGYGILILTGEKKVNPVWDDESNIDDIDISKRTLLKDMDDCAVDLALPRPRLPRMRRHVRLIMEDTVSWYGMIISDIGAETKSEVIEDKHIDLPERPVLEREKGLRIGPKEREIREKWEREERKSPCRGRVSLKEDFKKLWAKVFALEPAYAAEELKRFLVYPRAKIVYPKPIWPRHGAKGVVIILGRQHSYWHPPYPWPIEKKDLLPDSPKRKWIDRLYSFLEELFCPSVYAQRGGRDVKKEPKEPKVPQPPRRTKPNPGDGIKVYGAMLIAGERPLVVMKLADVFYSQEAINMVDKKLSTLRFIWEEYKEER